MPHSAKGSGKQKETQSIWAVWKKAAEESRFPPKIWPVQTAHTLTITVVSPSRADLTNDRSTPYCSALVWVQAKVCVCVRRLVGGKMAVVSGWLVPLESSPSSFPFSASQRAGPIILLEVAGGGGSLTQRNASPSDGEHPAVKQHILEA